MLYQDENCLGGHLHDEILLFCETWKVGKMLWIITRELNRVLQLDLYSLLKLGNVRVDFSLEAGRQIYSFHVYIFNNNIYKYNMGVFL